MKRRLLHITGFFLLAIGSLVMPDRDLSLITGGKYDWVGWGSLFLGAIGLFLIERQWRRQQQEAQEK